MYENRLYRINRKYYSILTFHDKSYWDSIETNDWELYGFIKRNSSRLDLLNENGWAARCDLHDGRFLDIKDGLRDTNSFTTINSGGYLKNKSTINIDNQDFTICCWFRLNWYLDRYSDHENYDVTLCGWTDSSGKKVSIDLYHKDYKTRLQNVTIRIYIDNSYLEAQYTIPGTMPSNGKWMFFSFQLYNGSILLHIDGQRVLDVIAENKYSLGTSLHELKIGAFKDTSSGGLDIDDFVIFNDHISYESYDVPQEHIYTLMPEIHYERIARSYSDRKYYKSGSLYGLSFKTLHINASSNSLRFSENIENRILGLFINNLYIPSTRYTVSGQTITLKEADDVSSLGDVNLVLLQQTSSRFKLSSSIVNVEESIEIDLPKKGLDKDSFLIFNGSLALVQENRYAIDSNKLTMTNPSDKLNGDVVFLYIEPISSTDTTQIRFLKLHSVIDERGVAIFERHEFIKFTDDNMVFFVNGAYLPKSSYVLYEHSLVLQTDHDSLSENDMVTAITMIDNSGPSVKWDLLNYINGSSQYNDIISSIDIVRNNNEPSKEIYLDKIKLY